MPDSLLGALGNLLSGAHPLYLLLGVGLGFVVGILPGLGGIVGFSLLLPFLYGMDPVSALAMLIGLVAVVPTSDTLTSVLLGIPGSSSSQATVVDGFPLAKNGEGARALAAAYSASLVGGLIGAAVLTLFVLVARPLVLLMGSAELFMLGALGVAMVGMLSGRDLAKGVAACGLGMLLGSVGAAPATGEWRMTFGSFYLYDGIKLVIIGLAVFAVPEIVELLAKGRSISDRALLGRGWLTGLRDTWMARWLVARCATIGCLIGALPGLGGSVVDWIAYGHAAQSAKGRGRFGSGDIRGVIAPESANNAKEGGGLVPTLLFGIPGSGSLAIFLGGLTLLGIEPGPAMAGAEIGFTYTIIWSLALANVLGAGLCILLSPQMARLTRIRYALLAPFMMMIVCFAAFQANKRLEDLLALAVLSAAAILMKRGGWPRPALLIGFVLADSLETYLYQAVQFYGWGFAARPGALAIGALTAAAVFSAARHRRALRPGKSDPSLDAEALRIEKPLALVFLACGLFALVDSLRHSFLGAVFPASMAALTVAACGFALSRPRPAADSIAPAAAPGLAALFRDFGWILSLLALTWLFGFVLAMTAVFVALLRLRGGLPIARCVALAAAGMGGLLALARATRLDFPWGLLQRHFELPWPLG